MFIEFIRSPPSVLLQSTYTYNTNAKTHRSTCTSSVLNYTVDRATGEKVVLQNWPYNANPTQLRRALLYYTPPQLTAPKSIFFVRTVIPLKTTQVHCYALPSQKKVPSKDKKTTLLQLQNKIQLFVITWVKYHHVTTSAVYGNTRKNRVVKGVALNACTCTCTRWSDSYS